MIYNYLDIYDPTQNYNKLDVVIYKKSGAYPKRLFLCLTSHTSASPQEPNPSLDTIYWGVINSESNFPEDVDQFFEFTNMSASDKPDVDRFQELALKASLTSSEASELSQLTDKLRNKLILPEDLNKIQGAITNVQFFLRSEIEGYIQTKQLEFQDYIDDKTAELNAKIGQFSDKDAYSPTTQYFTHNIVGLNGNTYIAKQDNIGHEPVGNDSDPYWRLLSVKGDKGETGISVNMKGAYDNTKYYFIGDAVQYNQLVYFCVQNTVGNPPPSTVYWYLYDKIINSFTEPVAPPPNLLWNDLNVNKIKRWNSTTSSWIDLSAADSDKLGGQLPSYYAAQSDVSNLSNQIGILTELDTTNKNNLVDAVNELNQKVTDKQVIYQLERELANLKAISSFKDRVDGSSGIFYDLIDGLNGGSIAKIDLTNTKSTVSLPTATSVLTDKVANALAGFKVGQEVTIYDDVNLERVTVTRAESLISTTTINRSTPTTVINQSYDTSGSGRKITRLSNGWIVVAVNYTSPYNILVYVSKDNGQTFSQMCSINGAYPGMAIVSQGNKVTVLYTQSTGTSVKSITFDATTVSNIEISGTALTVDFGQTTVANNVSLAINSTGTELHAVWSSKNGTYPNSFNLRYAKGTIDGSGNVTWGSVGYVRSSPFNTTGWDESNPCIVVKDNNPIIVAQAYNGATYLINSFRYTTSWQNVVTVYSVASYAQSNPSAVVSPDGTIHCVWHGQDVTNNPSTTIFYSKSTDGGVTWGVNVDLTAGNSVNGMHPSIAADKNNNLYVYWHWQPGANWFKIYNTTFNGISWSSVSEITTNTTGNSWYPSLCTNYTDFTEPLAIYRDSSNVIHFRGVFNASTTVNHLEITPTTKAFKSGAKIARTTAVYDTINKCLKFGGWDASTTYAVSNQTVISSAYDTSGNGGRKLVRLSNGWLVAGAFQSTPSAQVNLYKSTDNGTTWSLICSVSGGISSPKFALSNKGTDVYIIIGSGTTNIRFYKIDALTASGTISTGYTDVDSNQTALDQVSLAISPDGNSLWAAWSSKNSTYPNSFNIRTSKGTISSVDGSVTWNPPIYTRNDNTTGVDNTQPCIVIKSDDNPVIFWMQTQNSPAFSGIVCSTWNGSAWNSQKTIYNGASYAQSNPCAVVDSNNVIHVVWHGRDSTDTAMHNIRYSKSTDGITWSTAIKLTTGNTQHQEFPSVTVDKFNKVYVMWSGYDGTYYQLKTISYNDTWSSINTLTSYTNRSAMHVSTLENYREFTEPLAIWKKDPESVVFRGSWTTGTVVPVLVEDVRYNITPPSSIDEVVTFVNREAYMTQEYIINITEVN